MGSAKGRRASASRKVTAGDKQVPIGQVTDNPSYAASSVIERGTADGLRAKYTGENREPCLCGCGLTPSSSRSLFMPGHDSRVRHLGKQVLEGQIKQSDLTAPQREYLKSGGML
jgi:hypothetical protein